ncbi:VOC family protein [Chryseobacterium sp. HMWF035]|nr:hypothetical protein DBR25_12285 [Chryseobacterium sp. HMWF001]PVV55226.1 VOC family protein [Chryseobacterium sp. HMWF035]
MYNQSSLSYKKRCSGKYFIPKRNFGHHLPISKETCLMGSDTGGEWASNFKEGNNFSISINAESRDEADKLFNALSEGGQVTMPMNPTFWGAYFGMFADKFGINWMVNFDEQQA